MSDASIIVPGATYFGPSNTIDTTNYQKTSLEGQPHILPDQDLSFVLRSGRKVHAVAARNVSGITMMGGYAVTWKAGFRFRRFDGYNRLTGAQVAGIIDPHVTAVRNGDICLVYLHGPCLVKRPRTTAKFNVATDSDVWAVGDILYSITSAASTAVTTGATTSADEGRLWVWSSSADAMTSTFTAAGTVYGMHKVGRVMSALTASNTDNTTGTKVLVDLEFLPYE